MGSLLLLEEKDLFKNKFDSDNIIDKNKIYEEECIILKIDENKMKELCKDKVEI